MKVLRWIVSIYIGILASLEIIIIVNQATSVRENKDIWIHFTGISFVIALAEAITVVVGSISSISAYWYTQRYF